MTYGLLSEALYLIVPSALIVLTVTLYRVLRRPARNGPSEVARRFAATSISNDWVLARAEQDYVDGVLDLAGLEERVGQLLGLREKAPDITMAEADKLLAKQAQKKFADDEWARLHVASHTTTWTASIPGSSYVPPVPVADADLIDLVDATGNVIRRVPKTPPKPWHLIPGG